MIRKIYYIFQKSLSNFEGLFVIVQKYSLPLSPTTDNYQLTTEQL